MKGYLGRPDATAAMIDGDGWVHTGDIGRVDDDGWLFVVDRVKELIKYKGFQVAPAELEALLLTHDGIADAAVIGVTDAEGTEIPKAYVVRQVAPRRARPHRRGRHGTRRRTRRPVQEGPQRGVRRQHPAGGVRQDPPQRTEGPRMTPPEPLVALTEERGITTLALDSPATRNALSTHLVTELADALTACGKDPAVRAVVLTHTGGTFSAGADLKAPPSPYAFVDLLRQIVELPKPVVGLVTGHARSRRPRPPRGLRHRGRRGGRGLRAHGGTDRRGVGRHLPHPPPQARPARRRPLLPDGRTLRRPRGDRHGPGHGTRHRVRRHPRRPARQAPRKACGRRNGWSPLESWRPSNATRRTWCRGRPRSSPPPRRAKG